MLFNNKMPELKNRLKELRLSRINEKVKVIGSRHDRVIRNFSHKFNTIFIFFLKSYRSNILDFGGSENKFIHDSKSPCGKECFRLYENGYYSNGKNLMTSRHPNIIECVITAKKSWGLHCDMWSDGIVEGTFTKEEILHQFVENNITIPESLLINFYDLIYKKTLIKLK